MIVAAPGILHLLDELGHKIAYAVTVFFYFLILFQLLIATLWGLYYLGERIHQA